jgi:hypothetical protein
MPRLSYDTSFGKPSNIEKRRFGREYLHEKRSVMMDQDALLRRLQGPYLGKDAQRLRIPSSIINHINHEAGLTECSSATDTILDKASIHHLRNTNKTLPERKTVPPEVRSNSTYVVGNWVLLAEEGRFSFTSSSEKCVFSTYTARLKATF